MTVVETCDEKYSKNYWHEVKIVVKHYIIKEGWIIIYENINKIFNFIDITDRYVLLKQGENVKKVYVYEIEPVTLLNFSIDVQSNILNLYSEFLHELNFNFQIYISNKKINIDNYIKTIQDSIDTSGDKEYKELVEKYILSIQSKLREESIYQTKYYIVLSFNREDDIDINTIDNDIFKLEDIGCIVRRIKNKSKLMKLLYESINKEVVV